MKRTYVEGLACLGKSAHTVGFALVVCFAAGGLHAASEKAQPHLETNSIGMVLVRIQPGSFLMGNTNPTPRTLQGPPHLESGDWDEWPVHKVTIGRDFLVSREEVTEAQYQQFDPGFKTLDEARPWAAGLSWDQAVAFCQWLSKKEGKTYRLPSEAEWEYACRAGTQTLFASGNTLDTNAAWENAWGLRGVHTRPAEWCLDWHGMYQPQPQKDPAGPDHGIARVVRGGGVTLHWKQNTSIFDPFYADYYARSANRGGVIPTYKGQLAIGFRAVQAPLPKTRPIGVPAPFVQQCVRQDSLMAGRGPDPKKPYYRRRNILPIPPENSRIEAIRAAGFHPAILRHNHSPALEVCPNGDVLAVYYTSAEEYTPDVALLMTRLRCGSDEWDTPEVLFDLPDMIEASPLLWNDNGTIRLFWGGPATTPDVVMRMASSTDNGATWSPVEFVRASGPLPGVRPQPITSAFRDSRGTMYVCCDAKGADSFLWASMDEAKTWFDTGGRTGGRHTAVVALPNGTFYGMGGKSSDIEGYNTQSHSTDLGKSWTVSKTQFAALGANQRPTMIRLASGRLFTAADCQSFDGTKPPGITSNGAFVALSDDEGKTWHLKSLQHALPHESRVEGATASIGTPGIAKHPYGTLGYCVARQAPNGVVHLITSMNHPSQHFEFNEAWLLSDAEGGMASPSAIRAMKSNQSSSHFAVIEDGRVVLEGEQLWRYPTGEKQYQVEFLNGRKTGLECYWQPDGKLAWERRHEGKSSVWTQWWPNGKKKSESTWRDGRAVGTSRCWDWRGKLAAQHSWD